MVSGDALISVLPSVMARPSCPAVVFPKPSAPDAAARLSSFSPTPSHASRSCLFRPSCGLRLNLKPRTSTAVLDGGGGGGGTVEAVEDGEEEEEGLCPVDCVREFKTEEEFTRILDRSKETGALVVVDFYRTSCGSCKYIEQGFVKICKGSGDGEADVIFLKHNVIDEYDEQSEVAELLRIKSVPLFHFYKDGVLVEAFATRDKERIMAAILKHTPLA